MLVRAVKEFEGDQIPTVAASVTFFGLLALFPAIGAFVSLYGLFANVEDARRQIVSLSGFLPSGAVSVIGDQMERLAAMGSQPARRDPLLQSGHFDLEFQRRRQGAHQRPEHRL